MEGRRLREVEPMRSDGAVTVTLRPHQDPVAWYVLVLLLFALAALVGVVREAWGARFPTATSSVLAAAVFLAAFSFIAYLISRLVQGLFGYLELAVTPRSLTVTSVLFGIRRRRSFTLDRVSGVRFVEQPMAKGLVSRYVTFDYDGKRSAIKLRMNREEASVLFLGALKDLAGR